jgi:hypothetical protein
VQDEADQVGRDHEHGPRVPDRAGDEAGQPLRSALERADRLRLDDGGHPEDRGGEQAEADAQPGHR